MQPQGGYHTAAINARDTIGLAPHRPPNVGGQYFTALTWGTQKNTDEVSCLCFRVLSVCCARAWRCCQSVMFSLSSACACWRFVAFAHRGAKLPMNAWRGRSTASVVSAEEPSRQSYCALDLWCSCFVVAAHLRSRLVEFLHCEEFVMLVFCKAGALW